MNKACIKCDLMLNVVNKVAGEGSVKPRILFVYDYPTKTQDKHNSIFVGRYLPKLKQALIDSSLFDYTYHTFLIKCRPTFNNKIETYKKELITYNCSSEHFNVEFAKIKDHVQMIVPLGYFAYRFTTGDSNLKFDNYKNVLNRRHYIGDYLIYPIDDINVLIKEQSLSTVIKRLKVVFAHSFNPMLLINNK